MTISAEGLSTVINNISDAVFIHDKAGNILFVNDKMAELYCINKEQAKRLSIAKDLSGNDAAVNTLPDIWDKVLTNGTCDISFEWQAKRPNDGSCFDVHVRLFDILPALKDGDSWIVAEHYATAQAGSCFLEKS